MQESINLSELTVEQLEALGYRLVEQKSNLEQNLLLAQQELAKKRQGTNTQPTVEPEPVKDDVIDS